MDAIAEPTTPVAKVEIVNPVLPSDLDLSMSNFNAAMEAEKPKVDTPTEPVIETTKPATPETTKTEQVVPPEKKEDDIIVAETTTSDTKSKIPAELLTGKKAEPKVDDAIAEIDAMVLPKNAKPEQVASFSKLKEESKRVIQEKLARITELESKTSEGASRSEIEAAQERVKAAETKAKEYESTIERLAFTESPRFKAFITEESATIDAAKTYLEGTEINPQIIEVAARTTGSQRIKILRDAGADAELIAAVSPYLAQYDTIQRYKAGALENWKTESAQFADAQKRNQETQLAQRRAEEDKVWEIGVSKMRTEVAAFQKFEGNDEWNKQADELEKEWKRIYNGDDVNLELVNETLGYGVAFKAEHAIRLAVTEELNNANKLIARLKSAKPGASNGQVTSTTTNGDANLSFEEAAKRSFNREIAKVRGG